MASNNYTSANVVPSADTFREWVDLTNRITFDMEKVVVTVAANTQGARTSGNASVNGYFSANTLIVEHELTGATATGSVYGTKAAKDNLVIFSNTVLKANGAATGAILFAQSNAYFTGANVEFSSNVSINSTASVFSSNATLNDFNSNVAIDAANVYINGTNTHINGAELNVNANAAFEANVSMDAHTVELSSNNVKITANTNLFQSNATLNDFNSNVAIDAANVYINGTNTHINSTELNVDANTVFTANVNITDASADLNIGADVVTINTSATTFQSNAGTNIFNTPLDINANMDVDNTLTDFTSTTFNVSGTTALIDSTTTNIHGTTLDVNSNTSIEASTLVVGANSTFNGDVTATANVEIGNANTDLLNVSSNTVLNDKLKVVKNADFDAAVNVDGATTLNGTVTLGNAAADDITFTGNVASSIVPKTNGNLSLGTAALRWDGMFDDLRADDLTVDDDTGIGGNLTVDTNTQLDGTLTVNTALAITYPGSQRMVTVGAGTTTDDRLIIKSRVGNTTFGLMPLEGNNVPLGNSTNRWVITGKTGTFSSTLAAGDTTITGFMKASGEVEGGSLDINGVADISGNVDMHAGLDLEGTFAHSSGAHTITGAATFANTVGITGATTFGNTVGVTNTATFSNTVIITNTEEATASVGALKVSGGILALKDIKTAQAGQFGSVNVTGSIDVDTNANIDGNLVVDGTTILGNATGKTITMNGNVSRMVPSANSNSLGTNTKRWTAAFMTANTATLLDVGTAINVGSEANTNVLRVRSTSGFEGNSTWSRTGTTGDLTITANTIQHNMGIGGIVCANLVVSGTATLPSDTSLTLDTIGAKTINVADVINLGTGANSNPKVIFGSGAGSGSKANVIFTDAEFSTTFTPRVTNSIDLGTTSKKFKDGLFGTSVKVGTFNTGTSGTQIGTDAIETGTVNARDDLVASFASDKNLKDNILVIDNALNKIEQIGGYSYTWNHKIEDARVGNEDYGVIAQEIEEILPAAVKMNSRGHRTVSYNAIIPLLVEAIKELSAKVDELTEGDEE